MLLINHLNMILLQIVFIANMVEKRGLVKFLGIFTGLALFVSCLGLFGLALYASEQRKKEIGLRKVNGSGSGQIVWLLTADFTKLILIASVIACPVSYYLMHKWLQNFAYRTIISWWIFAITILLSCMVALATIGYQAYKAASTNPVNTLQGRIIWSHHKVPKENSRATPWRGPTI